VRHTRSLPHRRVAASPTFGLPPAIEITQSTASGPGEPSARARWGLGGQNALADQSLTVRNGTESGIGVGRPEERIEHPHERAVDASARERRLDREWPSSRSTASMTTSLLSRWATADHRAARLVAEVFRPVDAPRVWRYDEYISPVAKVDDRIVKEDIDALIGQCVRGLGFGVVGAVGAGVS